MKKYCLFLFFALFIFLCCSCGRQPDPPSQALPTAQPSSLTPSADKTSETAEETEPSTTSAEHLHTFGEWKIVKEATCISEGQKERSCTCGVTERETVPAAGHTPVADPGTTPTCTEEGLTAGSRCALCGEILEEQRILPPLGHDYQNGVCVRCGAEQPPGTGLVFSGDSEDSCKLIGIGNCRDSTVVIPNEYEGKPVVAIGANAFSKATRVRSVIIPDSVRVIEKDAFSGCGSLESVVIPEGVVWIYAEAFRDCTALKTVKIPDSVTILGAGAFWGCSSLTEAVIGNGVTKLPKQLFTYCRSLESVTLPEGLTEIGSSAFMNCEALKDLTLPESLRSIADNAFASCKSLAALTIPDGVTTIGAFAISNCTSLSQVLLPSGITKLEGFVLNSCSFEFISVPEGVRTIEESAISSCPSLKTVILPRSLEKIDPTVFSDCEALATVLFRGTEDEWQKIEGVAENEQLAGAQIIFSYKVPDYPIRL